MNVFKGFRIEMQRRDGSLRLYIQHKAPEGGETGKTGSLRLAGPFFMAGRFYGREASLIDGSYKIPECKRVIKNVRSIFLGQNS